MTLLSDLKGAQISIICALLIARKSGRESMCNAAIAYETGYSDPKAIALGLKKLCERGLIVLLGNASNKNEWSLTHACRQMFLPAGPDLLPEAPSLLESSGESGENLHSLACCCSSCINTHIYSELTQQQQQPKESGENLHSLVTSEFAQPTPPDEPLNRLLALGASEEKATAALARRRAHGLPDTDLLQRITAWVDYLTHCEGWQPANPGAFIAAAIADWRGIPIQLRPVADATEEDETAKYADWQAAIDAHKAMFPGNYPEYPDDSDLTSPKEHPHA